MFTIKHVRLCGEEQITQVETVRFVPAKIGTQGQSETPPTLWVAERGFDERPVTGGTVFVMNEQGKTVSRYDLGASPVPIIGDGLNDPRRQATMVR